MKKCAVFGIFLIMLIAGCASIDKKKAESNAVDFVNKNVKFFSRQENSTTNITKYSIDSMNSYQDGSNWVVAMHVSAKSANETKKNDLSIKLDSKGDVLEFNGKPVK